MSQGLRMVHLRTVPDAWHAKVLVARLGCEGIVTHLQGSVSGPYPFGAVAVLVEADQAELAASLLLADEVEAAFSDQAPPSLGAVEGRFEDDDGDDLTDPSEADLDLGRPRPTAWSRWRRGAAAAVVVLVAGAPLLAHFVGP